jgi:hypothetical protein
MDDSEAMAHERCVAGLLPKRDGYEVARLQLGIMSDRWLIPYPHRMEAKKVLCLFARQPKRQADQVG